MQASANGYSNTFSNRSTHPHGADKHRLWLCETSARQDNVTLGHDSA